MTIATIQFMSEALWRQVTYTALLPDETVVGPGPYPVVYQLHGGNQNHTSWLHAFLEDRRIAHTYQEHPGGHTWDYWDTHVPAALRQHTAAFQRL